MPGNGTIDQIKAAWSRLTGRQKLLVVGGGVALLVLMSAVAGQNGQRPTRSADQRSTWSDRPAPYADGQTDAASQDDPDRPSDERSDPRVWGGPGPNGQPGFMPGGMPATGGSGAPEASDPDGWNHRQAVQDRAARAFDEHIRDDTTIRDPNTGTVYTDVPNDVADPLVQSGAATQVPTSELPTTIPDPGPSPVAAPEPAPAATPSE